MWFRQTLIALAWAAPALLSAADARSLPDSNGKPRAFELTLTWEKHAPDGFEREMILTNGQFPGPLLEINHGDNVEITVHNKMPFNTTVHYHGIEMLHTPWSDGVPGLSQRPIQPGASFVYRWKATQVGSYWYHAHERGQLNDGMYGPIVIHPKARAASPFNKISNDPVAVRAMEEAEANVRPLVLSDHRHVTSERGWEITVESGLETPCYDSILINGKGRVDCWAPEKIASLLTAEQRLFLRLGNVTAFTAKGCLPGSVIANVQAAGRVTNLSAVPPEIFDECTATDAPLEVIEVKKSAYNQTWVAFDLIGTFGLITGAFSIDEHPMYVYAVDGDYIEPQEVEAITIANGDRYSVIVKLDKPGDFTIRMVSLTMPQMFAGYATLSYRDPKQASPPSISSVGYINDIGANTTADVRFFDQAKMKAFPPAPSPPAADQTVKVSMRVAGGQSYNWALNDTIYPMELDNETPLLFDPQPERHNNVTITTKNGTWVDLIFQAVAFPMPPHPIHKHGNKMYLLGRGDGLFKWSSVVEAAKEIPGSFNLVDPPRRDGFVTPAALQGPTWMAVRYHVNNPGAWLVHCHVQSHLQGGMSMAIQDGVDQWPTVPPEYLNHA